MNIEFVTICLGFFVISSLGYCASAGCYIFYRHNKTCVEDVKWQEGGYWGFITSDPEELRWEMRASRGNVFDGSLLVS